MVVVKCWQILERPIVRAFCSAFVQQTFGEDSGGCLLDPKSPLCLDDPRGFGGNGRQWAKCSAQENWLRAAKTGRLYFRISFWRNFFFNHYQHSTIFICTFHSLAVSWWYERTGEIGARLCETKHAIAMHWQGSTTPQPHSNLSLPCSSYSALSTCSSLNCERDHGWLSCSDCLTVAGSDCNQY